MKIGIFALGLLFVLAGCNVKVAEVKDPDGGGGNPSKPKEGRLNWSSISPNHHPNIDDINFNIKDIERLDVDIYQFEKDVEVVYSNALSKDTGQVRVYSVWNGDSILANYTQRTIDKNHQIGTSGRYQCQIETENAAIKKLKGMCIVRVQILLPEGSKVEVYNNDDRLTNRFLAVDNETFLKNIDLAMTDDEKLTVIEDYLASYTVTRKAASMTSEQLEKVLGEFAFDDKKQVVLEKMHSLVSDRENLGAVIDREFSYFEREQACATAGL